MRLTARVDYALRAAVELAAAEGSRTADELATAQGIPARFLQNILGQLRGAGLVASQRGSGGGHRLTRAATEVSLADVIRAVDGPLASVRDVRPHDLEFPGVAAPLQHVMVALRASERAVLEGVSLADVAGDRLPPAVAALAADPESWRTR